VLLLSASPWTLCSWPRLRVGRRRSNRVTSRTTASAATSLGVAIPVVIQIQAPTATRSQHAQVTAPAPGAHLAQLPVLILRLLRLQGRAAGAAGLGRTAAIAAKTALDGVISPLPIVTFAPAVSIRAVRLRTAAARRRALLSRRRAPQPLSRLQEAHRLLSRLQEAHRPLSRLQEAHRPPSRPRVHQHRARPAGE